LGLLREDVGFCASVSTVDQAAAIEGITTKKMTGRESIWGGSDEERALQKREKEQRLEAFRREWGYLPPEYPGG
jgi:hypothetical protein